MGNMSMEMPDFNKPPRGRLEQEKTPELEALATEKIENDLEEVEAEMRKSKKWGRIVEALGIGALIVIPAGLMVAGILAGDNQSELLNFAVKNKEAIATALAASTWFTGHRMVREAIEKAKEKRKSVVLKYAKK